MDISGDVTQCINHPNTPSDGAICALCLQEKLGKLVKSSSTSFSISQILPSSAAAGTSPPPSPPPNNNPSQPPVTSTTPGPTRPAHGNKKNGVVTAERRRTRFWTFFHRAVKNPAPSTNGPPKTASSGGTGSQNGVAPRVVNETPPTTSFARSRSVGCGSRSFSGDFFGKISTGFGGCRTLRRVESQREGKPNPNRSSVASVQTGSSDVIKERVRCGGIFSGFMMTSSSSSSSSSFRLSSSTASEEVAAEAAAVGPGRRRGRGWAFASPMRVFGRYSREEGKTSTALVAGKGKPMARAGLSEVPSLVNARG